MQIYSPNMYKEAGELNVLFYTMQPRSTSLF